MRTGFTNPFPTNVSQDYVIGRSTIAIQPVFVNLMWWNFPPELHHTILTETATLSAETEWYDAFRSDLPRVPYPRVTQPTAEDTSGGAAQDEDTDEEDDGSSNTFNDGADGAQLQGDDLSQMATAEELEEQKRQERIIAIARLNQRLAPLEDLVRLQRFDETQQVIFDRKLAQLAALAQSGDISGFGECEDELRLLIEESGQSSCPECLRNDVDGEMVACQGAHEQPVVMHWWCNPDLTSMPQGNYRNLAGNDHY